MSKLKICAQNLRGLRGQSKCAKLIVELERTRPDLMVLCDTHFSNSHHVYFRNLAKNYHVYSSLVNNASRGVSIIIKKSIDIEVLDKYTDNDGNIIMLKLRYDNMDFLLVGSYGPSHQDNPAYFEQLFDIILQMNTPNYILVGDHNCTLNPNMDNRGYRNRQNNPNAGRRMNELITRHQVDDIYRKFHPHSYSYTWENPEANITQKSRIDYFLTSASMSLLTKSATNYPITNLSDHSRIEIVIDKSNIEMGRGRWVCPSNIIPHNELGTDVRHLVFDTYGQFRVHENNGSYLDSLNINDRLEFFDSEIDEVVQHPLRIDPISFLDILVDKTITVCKNYAKRQHVIEANQLDLIQSELFTLIDKEDAISKQRQIDLRNQYSEILSQKSIDLFIERNKDWIKYGEKMTKTFFSLEKSKTASKYIAELFLESKKEPGREPPLSKNQSLIEQELVHFYTNRFADNNNLEEGTSIENFLGIDSNENYKLTDEARAEIDRELEIEEFDLFIDSIENKNSAPGWSGLSYAFYIQYWPLYRHAIFNAAKYIHQTGRMPLFLKKGLLSVLPKGKKDRRKAPNLRPLILQDVIYKIMSGVLTARLKKHIASIVDPDQSGFVAGRSMDENIRIISSVLEYAKRAGRKGIILSIDFQSAFDSIDHRFIKKSLRFFGFGPYFCKWVDIFLTDYEVHIMHAGKLLDPFSIGKGTKQGDILSPSLFIIGLEVLLIKLRNCPLISRYRVFNTPVNLSAYADDLNLVIAYDERSLRRILKILDDFKKLSGLNINTEKTQCMIFGLGENERPVKLCNDINLTWTPQLKFLGVILDNKYIQTDVNFDLKINEIKKVIARWDYKFLSPYGRKLIVQQLCISKLSQLAITLPNIDSKKLKDLENTLKTFIWGSKKNKVAWKDTKLPYSKGGMAMFCLESSFEAFKLKWLCKAVNNPNALWVRILNDELDTIIPGYSVQNIECWSKTDFDTIISNIGSIFWKEVFTAFLKGYQVYIKKYKSRGIMCNIWENPIFKYNANQKLIPTNAIFKSIVPYAFQFMKGYDENNQILFHTNEEMRERYDEFIVNDNFYNRVITAIKSGLQRLNITHEDIYTENNYVHGPALTSFINLQKKGCNRWSRLIKLSKLNNFNVSKRERKWEERLGIQNFEINWPKLYKLNEQIKFCNHLRFFHFLILKGNLETNTRSVNYRTATDQCTFCNRERETNDHLLWNCVKVREFRSNVHNAISNHPRKISLQSVPNTCMDRVLGTFTTKADNFPFMFYLTLNRYIWLTKLREGELNILAFKNHFDSFFKIQKSARVVECVSTLDLNTFWN